MQDFSPHQTSPDQSATSLTSPHSLLWPVAGAAITSVLLFQLICYGLSLALAKTYPSVSQTFYRTQPDAFEAIARTQRGEQLNATPGPAVPSETLKRLAGQLANQEPLSAAAFHTLARLLRQEGEKNALPLLQHARRLAMRDLETQLLLLQSALTEKKHTAAAIQIDILLRVYPRARSELYPIARALADDPKSRPALIKVLRKDPPWRASFLAAYPDRKERQDIAIALLLGIGQGPVPASEQERNQLMRRLLAWKSYDKAAYLWLQSQTASELANMPTLRNGDFENPIGKSPFGWQLTDIAGATTLIVRDQSPRDKVLLVSFVRQRVPYRNATQFLMLHPGSYRISGLYRTHELRSVRGLSWRLYCLGEKSERIFETQYFLGHQTRWTQFHGEFQIPPENCTTQLLRLENAARNSPEQMISGEIFFDNLQISKADKS